MPASKLPASIRYLKARLNVLKRPSVWGSAFIVLVSLIVLAEAWNNPERLTLGDDGTSTNLAEPTSPPEPTALDPLSSVEEPSLVGSPDASTNPFGQSPESEAQVAQGQTDLFDVDTFLLDPTLSIPVPSQPPTRQPSLFQPPSVSSDSNNELDVELPNAMSLTGMPALENSATNSPN